MRRRQIEPEVLKLSAIISAILTAVFSVLIIKTEGFGSWYIAVFMIIGMFVAIAHITRMILDIVDDIVHFSAKMRKR